jgi:hypothetical protein
MITLQKFDFKESKYERPQDRWVCGHLAEGKPCALGPGQNGQCRVTTVCEPRMDNGRWQCRRSQQEGGACGAGPLPDGACSQVLEPCIPRPSLRTRRMRAALWATALSIGLVALIVAGGATNRYLMPGALSSHHAGLAECSSCHVGSGPGKMDWVHQIVSSVRPKQNAELCLKCHNLGAQALAPHAHPVEALKRITQTLSERQKDVSGGWLQRITFSRAGAKANTAESEVYCATCHMEHQGEFHALTKVSNERCQTCHVVKFGSFAGSHPQFQKYPYQRRTRIVFDHVAHIGKHFPETAKSAAGQQVATPGCADCHQLGVEQKYMEVKPFEASCMSCHNSDIMGTTRVAGSKGINFLSVPGLDVTTLKDRGIDIGDWPEHSEATLTPFMQLLLAAGGGADVLAGLDAIDLIDLSKASEQDLAKVKALAWAVKSIFNRLETTRLEAAITGGRPAPDAERQRMATLTGTISHDVILGANREWFPNLQEDLERNEKGEPTRAFKPPEDKPEAAAEKTERQFDPEAWAEFGGWYRQDYTIRYRPSGHADPFLRAWLDVTSRAFGTEQEAQLGPIFEVLAAQDAVGRCAKCHSVDARGNSKQINWRPFYTEHIKNRFTIFAHKPHINAVGSKSCAACHQLKQESGEYLKTYEGGDPAVFEPSFQDIDKGLCASCHSKQVAWESCTLCHNYHVTETKESEGSRTAGAATGAGGAAR